MDALPDDYGGDSGCVWTCADWAYYGYCDETWSQHEHCVTNSTGPIKDDCKISCNQCGKNKF